MSPCGPNEIRTFAPSCIETCQGKPQVCQLSFQYGCFCQDGYVRESNNGGSSCVKREACKSTNDLPVCSENEEYTTCGSACAPTCDDLHYPLPKPVKPCIMLCRSGCFCKQGFYRSNDGKCVPPEQCCGKNERYKTCGSACVETCNSKPSFCTEQCISGCFCGCSDYVRQNNSTGSACIHRDDCSKECVDD